MLLTIDANRFDDIPGFYDEINRVFMADEDWKLGHSLDALDDLLYGGYGILKDAGVARLRWKNMDKSRNDLGLETTRRWLSEKLEHPDRFNTQLIRTQLDALDQGQGQTFFEIVLDIFASHKTLEIVSA